MSDSPNASGRLMGGALWASHGQAPGHSRRTMVLAIAGALIVECLIVLGVSHIHTAPPPPPRIMRITMPPPPPPPPEVKKLAPPPEPKPMTPKPPPPKPPPKAPPAKPAPVPKPAVIPAAPHPADHAPALATAPDNAAPAPPAAAAAPPAPPAPPAAPPAPPALHGVVDGRGHCQSVEPSIPQAALQRGISSDVTAHLTINPDGSVGDVTIVRASPPTTVFNAAVIAAAKAYKCQKNATSYVGEVVFSFKTTAASDDDD